MNDTLNQYVVFIIENKEYALSLFAVKRVVEAVEITPLLKAPDLVCGLINIQGEIIPVINMRRCFKLPERDIDPGDRMIIANTSAKTFSLWVDKVTDVVEVPENDVIARDDILNNIEDIEGALVCDDGMILIYNLEELLGKSLNWEETA